MLTILQRMPLALTSFVALSCANGVTDAVPLPDPTVIRRVDACTVPPVPAADAVTVLTDQPYATVDGRVLRFDLARPKVVTSPRPLVVLFHGGGFKSGNKNGLRSEIMTLASLGYAAASVEYRLSSEPGYQFPAPFSDARCALRVLSTNATGFLIDPARIAIGGTSAGAGLALTVGMNSSTELDAALPAAACDAGHAPLPTLQGIVSWYGGGDARNPALFGVGTAEALAQMLGGTPAEVPERAALVSAVLHVDRLDPPTLHLHGTADAAVSIQQAVTLDATMRAAGVPSLLVSLPGIGHAFEPLSADPVLQSSTCSALQFLSDRLHP